MIRRAFRTCFLASVVACGSSEPPPAPSRFGQRCDAEIVCAEGLTCTEGRCLGDIAISGAIFWQQSNPPTTELHVFLNIYGERIFIDGKLDPHPDVAIFDVTFPSPITYPHDFQFVGLVAGNGYTITAFVPFGTTAVLGHANFIVYGPDDVRELYTGERIQSVDLGIPHSEVELASSP